VFSVRLAIKSREMDEYSSIINYGEIKKPKVETTFYSGTFNPLVSGPIGGSEVTSGMNDRSSSNDGGDGISTLGNRSLMLAGQKRLPKPEWHPKWKLMRVISGHTGWVRSVTVDATNEWFATGSVDRTIKVNMLFTMIDLFYPFLDLGFGIGYTQIVTDRTY
jgi:WD40 repeat protein